MPNRFESCLFACSSSIQQCLMTGSVWEAIGAVDRMGAVHARLRASGCSHLQDFLQETLAFWHKIVKDRLSRCGGARLFACDGCRSLTALSLLFFFPSSATLKRFWLSSSGRTFPRPLSRPCRREVTRSRTCSLSCSSHSFWHFRPRILRPAAPAPGSRLLQVVCLFFRSVGEWGSLTR